MAAPLMADCLSCGEPIRDTAYICHREAVRSGDRWAGAAGLWRHVAEAVLRQTRSGQPGPRPRGHAPAEPVRPDGGELRHYADQALGWPTGLPVNLRASDSRDWVRTEVTTWARVVAGQTGADLPPTVGAAWLWLAGRVGWMRYQRWAFEAFDALDDAAAEVARTVDRPPGRVDAGICGAALPEGGRCEQWLSAPPGAIVIRCRGCRALHDTQARHRDMLVAARDHRGSAAECARWLSRLGVATTAAMVRGLAHRRRILADAHGHYRLGDVEMVRREIVDREAA